MSVDIFYHYKNLSLIKQKTNPKKGGALDKNRL